MKAYRKNRGLAPLIVNLGTKWRYVVNFTPQMLCLWEIILVPIE
jgi:hypothetical protein